jgi:predicted permease
VLLYCRIAFFIFFRYNVLHPTNRYEAIPIPSMQIVFGQILIILLYVLIGYFAGKGGLINPDQRKYLTRICTDLIMPFTVLSAVNQDITPQQMVHLGLILILLLIMSTIFFSVSLPLIVFIGTRFL